MESLLSSKMQTRIEVRNTFISMVSQLYSWKPVRDKLLLQLHIIQLDCQLITKPLGARLLQFKNLGKLLLSPRIQLHLFTGGFGLNQGRHDRIMISAGGRNSTWWEPSCDVQQQKPEQVRRCKELYCTRCWNRQVSDNNLAGQDPEQLDRPTKFALLWAGDWTI